MIETLFNYLRNLQIKIKSLVKRGYVSNTDDDSKDYPFIQVSYGSPTKTAIVERISPYGLYVNFPKDIQVLLFSVIADEANRAAIAYSQKDRFKNLKPGEVVIGNPQTQSFIKFDEDGNIEIDSKNNVTITINGNANISANNVNIDAAQINLGVGGNEIARKGDTVQVDTGTGLGTITGGGTNTSI